MHYSNYEREFIIHPGFPIPFSRWQSLCGPCIVPTRLPLPCSRWIHSPHLPFPSGNSPSPSCSNASQAFPHGPSMRGPMPPKPRHRGIKLSSSGASMIPRRVWCLRGLLLGSRGKPGGRVGAWGLVPRPFVDPLICLLLPLSCRIRSRCRSRLLRAWVGSCFRMILYSRQQSVPTGSPLPERSNGPRMHGKSLPLVLPLLCLPIRQKVAVEPENSGVP